MGIWRLASVQATGIVVQCIQKTFHKDETAKNCSTIHIVERYTEAVKLVANRIAVGQM